MSTRLAARIARRDIARHKGRSALIVALIAIPVALLVAASTLAATDSLTPVKRLPWDLGQARASLTHREIAFPVHANGTPNMAAGQGTYTQASPPGWGETLPEQIASLKALVGNETDVIAAREERVYVQIDGKRRSAFTLAFSQFTDWLTPKTTLKQGRWPTHEDEVVVTPKAISQGFPDRGTLTMNTDGGGSRTVTVVGVADAVSSERDLQPVDLVVFLPPTSTPGPHSTHYLVQRANPITLAEATQFGQYGIEVVDRDLVLVPVDSAPNGAYVTGGGLTASLATLMFVGVALLAGPAFTVSAARQRRTLALAASNGATRSVLRRVVIVQALILGVFSALAGSAIGVGAAAAIWQIRRSAVPGSYPQPLDLALPVLAMAIVGAVLASMIAALLPARGLGKLNVIAVLRGQAVQAPPHRGTPWIGFLVFALGVGLMPIPLLNIVNHAVWSPVLLSLGMVCVLIGGLMIVPTIMTTVAHHIRPMPWAVRMAVRDSGRQHGGATSSVAAIMGSTFLFCALVMPLGNYDTLMRANYVPRVPYGTGLLQPLGDDQTAQEAATARLLAWSKQQGWQAHVQRNVMLPTTNGQTSGIVAYREDCPISVQLPSGGEEPLGCHTLSTLTGYDRAHLVVMEGDAATSLFGLDKAQRTLLDNGGILVNTDDTHNDKVKKYGIPAAVNKIEDGHVRFANVVLQESGKGPLDSETPSRSTLTIAKEYSVPAAPLPKDFTSHSPHVTQQIGAVVTPHTAKSLGWEMSWASIYVKDPRGPITPAVETKAAEYLVQTGDGSLEVEFGYQSPLRFIITVAAFAIGLVILVASLVATALKSTEMEPLQATLAAVGATRRMMAAVQAGWLALLGTTLGLITGGISGTIYAQANNARVFEEQELAQNVLWIPWPEMAALWLGVPLVAAGFAWIAVRRHPVVTKRM